MRAAKALVVSGLGDGGEDDAFGLLLGMPSSWARCQAIASFTIQVGCGTRSGHAGGDVLAATPEIGDDVGAIFDDVGGLEIVARSTPRTGFSSPIAAG